MNDVYDIEKTFKELCCRIVQQAIYDYKRALRCHGYEGKKSHEVIEECEKFFRSDFCRAVIPTASSDEIITALHIQIDYEEWRTKQKCSKCKIKKCIYRSGIHWTAYTRGDLCCLKKEDNAL